jgi:hypothetical protein
MWKISIISSLKHSIENFSCGGYFCGTQIKQNFAHVLQFNFYCICIRICCSFPVVGLFDEQIVMFLGLLIFRHVWWILTICPCWPLTFTVLTLTNKDCTRTCPRTIKHLTFPTITQNKCFHPFVIYIICWINLPLITQNSFKVLKSEKKYQCIEKHDLTYIFNISW